MSAVSFSQINSMRVCPRQFQAKYITKEVEFQHTVATRWGVDVHEALEHRLRDKTPLPMNMVQYEGDAQMLENIPGVLTAEHKLTIDAEGNPCDWWSDKAVSRGILDVLIKAEDKATIFDWKTGKFKSIYGQYASSHKGLPTEELDFFAMLLFISDPKIEKIKNIYRWLKLDAPPTTQVLTREQLPILVEGFGQDIEKLEEAKVYDKFPPKRGGLCRKWCQVTACKFCGS